MLGLIRFSVQEWIFSFRRGIYSCIGGVCESWWRRSTFSYLFTPTEKRKFLFRKVWMIYFLLIEKLVWCIVCILFFCLAVKFDLYNGYSATNSCVTLIVCSTCYIKIGLWSKVSLNYLTLLSLFCLLLETFEWWWSYNDCFTE